MADKPKDFWDKVSVAATAIAALFVPVILGLAANAFNASLKDKDIKVEVMKLAEDLLKADPAIVNQPGIRDWAKKVLSDYSGVPLSEAAKDELDKQPLLLGNTTSDSFDRDPDHLHPGLRAKVSTLLQRLNQEGLRFELLDGFRNPTRQLLLYSEGRLSGGQVVTHAKPWTGLHSFGLAADLVQIRDKKVYFGPDLAGYRRMHAIAKDLGLKTIEQPFADWPHVEMADVTLADLQAGKYPAGGDASWANHLSRSVTDWGKLVSAIQAWGTQLPTAPPPPVSP